MILNLINQKNWQKTSWQIIRNFVDQIEYLDNCLTSSHNTSSSTEGTENLVLIPVLFQSLLKNIQSSVNIFRCAIVTHYADSPNFPCHVSQAPSNLHFVAEETEQKVNLHREKLKGMAYSLIERGCHKNEQLIGLKGFKICNSK